MKPAAIWDILRPRPAPAPYNVRRLARCESIEDLADVARRRLPRTITAYVDGGGEAEVTLRRNRSAFEAIELLPHVLRDVSHLDTTTRVLDTPMTVPIAFGPVGAPRIVHHAGEIAVARAARSAGIPMALSTVGNTSIEDLARTGADLWMQLYIFGDRRVDADIIARAAEAGYRAVLVTVDCTVRSKRERERRAGLSMPTPQVRVRTIVDGMLHPWWSWQFVTHPRPTFPNIVGARGLGHRSLPDLAPLFDGTVTWDDLVWIREQWHGPLAVKGIMRAADARRAADAGATAIIVSNHGGRQLDQVPATIDVLPEIVAAVGERVEVLLDSGVRRGSDVAAAIALGARAVLVGRAYLYGLAAAGEAGVRYALDLLSAELRTTMALSGARTLTDLDVSLIVPGSHHGRCRDVVCDAG